MAFEAYKKILNLQNHVYFTVFAKYFLQNRYYNEFFAKLRFDVFLMSYCIKGKGLLLIEQQPIFLS